MWNTQVQLNDPQKKLLVKLKSKINLKDKNMQHYLQGNDILQFFMLN